MPTGMRMRLAGRLYAKSNRYTCEPLNVVSQSQGPPV